MRHLHEESCEQRFPYVFVKLCFRLRVRGAGFDTDIIAFHDSLKLCANVLCLDEVAFRQVVFPCPLVIPDICGEWNRKEMTLLGGKIITVSVLVIRIEQREVVTTRDVQQPLRLISFPLFVDRSHPNVRRWWTSVMSA